MMNLLRLIDQALAKGVKVAVCSTSNEKAVMHYSLTGCTAISTCASTDLK